MMYFGLIALMTAGFTLVLDRAMQKEKIAKRTRCIIMLLIPALALGLYLYLGNILFV